MEWHPIETAPKDGTEVIVFDPTNTSAVFVASFNYGDWTPTTVGYPPVDYMPPDADPTHWMPLPSPPK